MLSPSSSSRAGSASSWALSKLLGQPVTCFAKVAQVKHNCFMASLCLPSSCCLCQCKQSFTWGGWPASALSQPGEREEAVALCQGQLPADPCGSVRAAKEALVGLHAPTQGWLCLSSWVWCHNNHCVWGTSMGGMQRRLLHVPLRQVPVGEMELARSCHVSRQLLVGMSWGSEGTSPTLLPSGCIPHRLSCPRARRTQRRFPSPRSRHQKAPEFAEGCVLPFVVFLPCLEKGFEV